MILVSACLVGINCKYNGDNNKSNNIEKYLNDKQFIIVCPEQLGGLSTPRTPSEIINYNSNQLKVISKDGKDVTDNFINGAKETLKIAKMYKCTEAILKEGSPSCGSNKIYDGSFSGIKIEGIGVTAEALKKEGLKILTEKDFEK
ncbi:MAG: DUF523 domain-containing protein [Paraclostridium sp.]